jgi:hypothetical protein
MKKIINLKNIKHHEGEKASPNVLLNKARDAKINDFFSKAKNDRVTGFKLKEEFNISSNQEDKGFEVDKKKLALVCFALMVVLVFGFFIFSYISNNVFAGDAKEVEEIQENNSNDSVYQADNDLQSISVQNEAIAEDWDKNLDKEVDIVLDDSGNEILEGGDVDLYGFVDDRHYYEPLNPSDVSPISGIPCENKDRRPIAVMLSADKAVRPLSGIGEADMVFEMQVITGTITRLMPVFLCNSPGEIGSIRSVRHDYIALAKGVDAILAHWGGSHFALDYLKNKNTVSNLDAMKNPHGAFFRKQGVRMPHNGFASYDGLFNAAKKMGFRLENKFEGYPHRPESRENERGEEGRLEIGFPKISKVAYDYNKKANAYLRFWNGEEDIDKLTGKRLAPKNVVVVFADSRQIEGQYNDVDIEGEGKMLAFMEGRRFEGGWRKEKTDCAIGNELVCINDKRLKFYKENGEEIEFIPGQIWVEIVDLNTQISWN